MGESAIIVRNLSKQYILGGERDRHITFREMLANAVKAPMQRLRKLQGTDQELETFWALKDISFEVQPGEVLGIIGRNGAGKSTLLKILSRITAPTTGEIVYRGRLASLLEVGTGFHPELSGRENIFINGAILGMSRGEIRKKFDEIVDFAGVEKFLDTPVKRYSSGMYVRLAFAVAAHLDPDILIVDEVLAVGDAEFQKKCLGKMKDVSKGGRTVLFVSHNMMSISLLCKNVLWLDKGSVISLNTVRKCVQQYLSRGVQACYEWVPESSPDKEFIYKKVCITTSTGKPLHSEIPADQPFRIEFHYQVNKETISGRIALRLTNMEGIIILSSAITDKQVAGRMQNFSSGKFADFCEIPGHLLSPGQYSLTISEPVPHGPEIVREDILFFTVSGEMSLKSIDGRGGVISPMLTWGTV